MERDNSSPRRRMLDMTRVYLVGAGPGDPGLITRRGWECLTRADLVLYDSLSNPQLLEAVRPGAECVSLGRHGQGPLMPHAEVIGRMIAAAKAGKTVVRLKGGDPGVFGRLNEEITALEAAGIEYEIVPGVSAAVAAGSYAGLSLTHREAASAVAFITGQETSEKSAPGCDYRALATFPGTLVFYMGVTTARHWTAELIAGGLAGATPALIVRRCTWPDQVSIRCRLDEVAARLEAAQMRPPVVVIIGDVAESAPTSNWFTRRPLHGQTVLLTRPRERNVAAQRALEELGARVLLQPTIELRPPADGGPLDDAIAALPQMDWLVFVSARGVESFFLRLFETGRDLRTLGHVRLAAVGPATADELLKQGLVADLVPDEFRAESLAEALSAQSPQRVLIVRGSRGRDVLVPALAAAGHSVREVVAYESVDVEMPDPEIARALAEGRIDWVTVTSSAIARSLVKMFGSELRKSRLASLSPITSETLRELGHAPAVEAEPHSFAALIDAMVRQSTDGSGSV